MKTTKNTIRFLTLAPIVFIPLFVFLLSLLVINAEEDNFADAIAQLENDFIENEKARIRYRVNNMADLIHYRQSIIDQNLHDRIQKRVEDARRIALAIHSHYHEKLPPPEIKELIIEALRPLQWNNGESYIWIIDFEGTLQLGPDYLKPMEQSSILHHTDLTGRRIIEEEIAIATSAQGKGFLWDSFTKPGEPKDKHFKQLAFVNSLGVYDWYIGSAEFLDTATKSAHAGLLETINQIGKGDSDYIFVIDRKGLLLLNFTRPDLVGRKMSETTDEDLQQLFKSIVDAADSQAEEFIEYHWLNPHIGTVEKKMAYIKAVEDSSWIIGSGFYPKMLEQGYEVQKQRLRTQHNQKIDYLNKLMLISIIGSFLISMLMSMAFHRLFNNFQQKILDENNDLRQLNLELEESQIQLSNELKEVEKTLREEKTLDSVTQLPNRKYLLNRLQQEFNRANRYHSDLSVIVIEISNFADFVEGCTEEEMQSLLIESSIRIKHLVRNVDLLGRIGLDEFMIIMPEVSPEEARILADRIATQLRESDNCLNQPLRLISTVAAYEHESSLVEFLKQLDIAMYQNSEQQSFSNDFSNDKE